MAGKKNQAVIWKKVGDNHWEIFRDGFATVAEARAYARENASDLAAEGGGEGEDKPWFSFGTLSEPIRPRFTVRFDGPNAGNRGGRKKKTDEAPAEAGAEVAEAPAG